MKHTNLAVALPLTVGMETGSRSRAIRPSIDCGRRAAAFGGPRKCEDERTSNATAQGQSRVI